MAKRDREKPEGAAGKIKFKGLIVAAVMVFIFSFISAGLFVAAINPADVYSDIINNGGIVFSSTTSEVHNDQMSQSVEGANKIIINLSVNAIREDDAAFKVIASEDENVHLSVVGTYFSAGKNEMEVTLTKDNADINATVETNTNWFSLVPFNFINFFTGEITVQIPADYAGALIINVSAGTLDVDVDNTFSSLKIDMSAGTMNIKNADTASSLKIDMSAGTMNINSIAATDEVKIKLSAGTLKCDKIVSRDVTAEISAGTLTLSDVAASGKISAKASAGTIALKVSSRPSEVELRVSAGTLNFSHATNVDYKVSYSLSAGSLYIYGTKYHHSGTYNQTGSTLLTVSISAGTCNIKTYTP